MSIPSFGKVKRQWRFWFTAGLSLVLLYLPTFWYMYYKHMFNRFNSGGALLMLVVTVIVSIRAGVLGERVHKYERLYFESLKADLFSVINAFCDLEDQSSMLNGRAFGAMLDLLVNHDEVGPYHMLTSTSYPKGIKELVESGWLIVNDDSLLEWNWKRILEALPIRDDWTPPEQPEQKGSPGDMVSDAFGPE